MSAAAAQQNANAYLRTKVMTASPEELRLMLLEGAIKFTRQGREGLATKNYEQSFTGLSAAREIVVELMTTIRDEPNPELAQNVRAVLQFIYQQIVEGGFQKDLSKLDKALELLEFERETWVMLMQSLASERGGTTGVPQAAPTAPEATPDRTQARQTLSIEG